MALFLFYPSLKPLLIQNNFIIKYQHGSNQQTALNYIFINIPSQPQQITNCIKLITTHPKRSGIHSIHFLIDHVEISWQWFGLVQLSDKNFKLSKTRFLPCRVNHTFKPGTTLNMKQSSLQDRFNLYNKEQGLLRWKSVRIPFCFLWLSKCMMSLLRLTWVKLTNCSSILLLEMGIVFVNKCNGVV